MFLQALMLQLYFLQLACCCKLTVEAAGLLLLLMGCFCRWTCIARGFNFAPGLLFQSAVSYFNSFLLLLELWIVDTAVDC
jgi:hypothetical protein